MHTLMVIVGGIVLLLVFILIARSLSGGVRTAAGKAALYFVPVWFVAALINLWVGVSQAGYTVAEEAPIFCVVFGVPAIIALIAWRRFSRN